MTLPKTVWNYSRLTEAVRILQIAYYIKNQFYLKKGFFILPYNVPQNPKVIYFPKLPYQKIKDFWQKVKQNSEELIRKNDPIITKIEEILPEKKLDYSLQKNQWQKIANQVWRYLKEILPQYFSIVKTLEIRPTAYGSITTAYSTWLKDNQKIVIYLRNDADRSHIVEGILIDRLHKLAPPENRSWEQIEGIIDFLLTETPLAKLLKNYQPTLSYLRQKQQAELAKDSKKYLERLGFWAKRRFTITNDKPLLDGKKLPLSDKEERLLTLLIEKRDLVVSFDEIADKIWDGQAEEKFSLYAISKLIQRLREKLALEAIFPEIIQACKGKGYMLAISF